MPKQVKVCSIITGLTTGGAETVLFKLLQQLDRNIFSPHVISLTDGGTIGPRIEAAGIPVEMIRMRRGIPDPFRFFQLIKRLRDISPDVVHTWMYHADLIGGLAARAAGAPRVIWGVRSADFIRADTSRSTKLVFWMCAKMSRWLPDIVLYNSQKGMMHHHELEYREQRSIVIPNGIDSEAFAPSDEARKDVRRELHVPPNTPLLGMVGRFDPLKNHDGFIEAATYLHRTLPDVHFVLVGQGIEWDNVRLARRIEQASLTKAFHLLGHRSDIARITAALDVAALTSWSEAFPNVLVEAMVCGVPCVSTDVGDANAILGDAQWIVSVGDMPEFAARCAKLLLLPPEERVSLSHRGRRRAIELFDLKAIARRYERVYLDAVTLTTNAQKEQAESYRD